MVCSAWKTNENCMHNDSITMKTNACIFHEKPMKYGYYEISNYNMPMNLYSNSTTNF